MVKNQYQQGNFKQGKPHFKGEAMKIKNSSIWKAYGFNVIELSVAMAVISGFLFYIISSLYHDFEKRGEMEEGFITVSKIGYLPDYPNTEAFSPEGQQLELSCVFGLSIPVGTKVWLVEKDSEMAVLNFQLVKQVSVPGECKIDAFKIELPWKYALKVYEKYGMKSNLKHKYFGIERYISSDLN